MLEKTNIELVDIEDVSTGRGRGRKGSGTGKYSKYRVGLESHIQWFKDEIEKSKDGSIRIKNADIIKNIGSVVGRNPTSIYWAVKYVLFQEGMWVSQGKHKGGDDILVIRMTTKDDKLPPSLAKKAEGVEVKSDEEKEDGITE